MKDKLIALLRSVPITDKTYPEYIEAVADMLIDNDVIVPPRRKEKCPCETDKMACCCCVSMHCHECLPPNHSKFVQGSFCSACGRPLKGAYNEQIY